MSIFTEIEKIKVYIEPFGQDNLNRKNKVGGIITDFKICYKAIVIKPVWWDSW
jgi:hypothetical protein